MKTAKKICSTQPRSLLSIFYTTNRKGKTMKKTFVLLLVLLLMLAAPFALSEEAQDYTYNYGWLYVTGYTGQGGDITLPAVMVNPDNTANVWRAKAVAQGAFAQNQTITGVTIPDNYQAIQEEAFLNCAHLVQVSLPQGLVAIDDRAFSGCTSLTEITFPAGISFIGNSAFYQAENLAAVRFEGPAPRIEKNAFGENAQSLTFYVPDDQLDAYLAEFAYALGQDALVNIVPSGQGAITFDHTAVLGQALTAGTADALPEDMFDFDAATGTITQYKGFCARVDIPQSIHGIPVTAIGYKAFNTNGYLYYVSIPQGVTLIEKSAFDSIPHLSWAELPSTLKEIGENALYAYAGERLVLNEGLESIGRRAFGFTSKRLKSITVPSTLHTIGEEGFYSSGAEQLMLNEGLQSIGDKAFSSSDLKGTLVLPEGLETIGKEAFSRTDIEKVKLPASIKFIDDQAFSWCMKLKELVLAANIMPEFGENVFEKVSMFHGEGYGEQLGAVVTIPAGGTQEQVAAVQTAFDEMGLKVNAQLAVADGLALLQADDYEIRYKDDYRLLANYRGNLSEVLAPEKYGDFYLDGVYDGAFKDNQTLSAFAVPHNGKYVYIGADAFAGSNLSSLDLYTSVTRIDDGAFANTQLTEVDLSSVTHIGARAFENTPLSSVILNENIVYIGENAFLGTKPKSFIIPANAQMDASSLTGIPLESIRISDNATDEQKEKWNETLGFAWFNPLLRVSEKSEYGTMPNTPSNEADFTFDPSNGMITAYTGSAVDVVIPRAIGGVEVKIISYGAFDMARDYTDTDMIGDEQTHWLPLRSIVIPETVTTIEDGAFAYCQQLKNVICYAPLDTTGRSTFQLCRSLKNVIFVNGVKVLDNYLFSQCDMLENVYYRGMLDTIGDSAFEFSGIPSFVANTKAIGDSAFRNCESLREIHIRNPLEKMSLNAFYGCSSLDSICMEFRNTDVFDDTNGYSGNLSSNTMMILPIDTTDDEMQEFYRLWGQASLGPIAGIDHIERADCLHPDNNPLPNLDMLLSGMDEAPNYEPKPTSQTAGDLTQSTESVTTPNAEPSAENKGKKPIPASGFIGVQWVCTKAEASGFPLDIAMLGRYDVLFNADGTASMTIGGIDMPGAEWTLHGENIIVDYYGVPFVFEYIEDSLQLNYYDSMLLTYEKG